MKSTRKGQGSMEFIMITAMLFFICLGLFVVVQARISSLNQEKINEKLTQLGNLIQTEIRLASIAEGGYARTFILPSNAQGYNYSVNISGINEIEITIEGTDYLIFTSENISLPLSKIGIGRNLIQKNQSGIIIIYPAP